MEMIGDDFLPQIFFSSKDADAEDNSLQLFLRNLCSKINSNNCLGKALTMLKD
jgi:hypothetical protein